MQRSQTSWLQKVFVLIVSFSMLIAPIALAAGVTGPTGPQGVTGPTSAPGPTAPTGPQTPTGPIAPTGVQSTSPVLSSDTSTPDDLGSPTAASQASTGASTSDLSNDTTGSQSENTNTDTRQNELDSTTNNNADITNDLNLDLSTGDNQLNQNTKIGSLTTGDIQGSVTLVNVANSQLGSGSSVGVGTLHGSGTGLLELNDPSQRMFLPTNTTTGANSENSNTFDENNIVRLTTNNDASATNDLSITALTGGNELNQNTQVGDIVTGSVDLAINLVNLLNLNLPNTQLTMNIWSIFGDVLGNIFLPESTGSNDTTGANSENSNTSTTTTNADISVTQNANATNGLTLDTNTGGNTLAQNSTVGNVTTGDTNVDGSVTTVANITHPIFYIINVLGDWTGQMLGFSGPNVFINQLSNDTTGANSTNTNTANETNDVTATVNNQANATNNLAIHADTGHNSIQNNSTVGNVETGSITVLANVVNFLNGISSTYQNFTLGIINIFGDWHGTAQQTKDVSTLATKPVSQEQVTNTPETTTPAPQASTTLPQGGGTLALADDTKQVGSSNTSLDNNEVASTATTPSETQPSPKVQVALSTITQLPETTAENKENDSSSINTTSTLSGTAKILLADSNAVANDTTETNHRQPLLPFALGTGAVALLWGALEAISFRRKQA